VFRPQLSSTALPSARLGPPRCSTERSASRGRARPFLPSRLPPLAPRSRPLAPWRGTTKLRSLMSVPCKRWTTWSRWPRQRTLCTTGRCTTCGQGGGGGTCGFTGAMRYVAPGGCGDGWGGSEGMLVVFLLLQSGTLGRPLWFSVGKWGACVSGTCAGGLVSCCHVGIGLATQKTASCTRFFGAPRSSFLSPGMGLSVATKTKASRLNRRRGRMGVFVSLAPT